MNTERAIELIPLSGFKVLRKREFISLYKITVNNEEPIDTIKLKDGNAKYLKVVMTERKTINGTKYGYSLYELEAYSKTELTGAEKLLEGAEKLLNEPTKGAKADKERMGLIAAQDELESYLGSDQEFDGFTLHILIRTLETRMDSYRNGL